MNIDFGKLDKIVEEFVNNKHNSVYINNLNQVIPLCEEIINKKDLLPVETKEYSTNYDLNKKIELVSSFLGTLNINLKDQFDNLVKMVDEDGTPAIRFDSNDRNYAREGKAFIKINDDLYDMFMILHESLHVMNYYNVVDENNNYMGENNTRKYYGEAVSISAEKLFGNYLVKNNYITKNDYNILMNNRLISSKCDAKAVIIESILVDMKQAGIEINYDNIKNYVEGLELSEAKKEAVSEEFQHGRDIWNILDFNEMQFPIRQRYVIAQALIGKLSTEELVKLNYEVGNPDASLTEVTSSIRK